MNVTYRFWVSNAGFMAEGLSPDFEALHRESDGFDLIGSAPSITEIGGGWYKFTIPQTDMPIVGVVDADPGDSNNLDSRDRYIPVFMHEDDYNLDLQLSSLNISASQIADAVWQEPIDDHDGVSGSAAQYQSVLLRGEWELDGSTLKLKTPEGVTFQEFTISTTARTPT